MPVEIERKFLVAGDGWRSSAGEGQVYRQGYIATQHGTTVRVRTAGDQGYLTLKGQRSGISRSEFEYPIPLHEAEELLNQLCDHPLIEKRRYFVAYQGAIWEVDEFEGLNQGLLIAEIELTDENQQVAIPDWVGEEVSEEMRYTNLQLSLRPFTTWAECS